MITYKPNKLGQNDLVFFSFVIRVYQYVCACILCM